MENKRYNAYSDYLFKKYGSKVYKLPVNIPCTCPNRDGTLGKGGCIFCGEKGAGFENLANTIPVKEQLIKNMDYIRKKYKAEKFIAYFQNFSNTYIPYNMFEEYISQAVLKDIVEISISTRPDCIHERYLKYLKGLSENENINITMELGLQTVNYHTLKIINRGHTLAEFIDGVLRVKNFGFGVCAHVIADLPWDDMEDAAECAKVLSSLGVNEVKIHSLYFVKDTLITDMYFQGNIIPLSMEDYIERVILFLEYLDPSIAIQRLIGRAPEEDTLQANWGVSWWKIRDMIEEKMEKRDTYQGKKFDYLGGKAVKKFLI